MAMSTFWVLAKVITVQEPIFHASKIIAKKVDCNCRRILDLTVKENVKALYFKMMDKGISRAWVTKKRLVVRRGSHLYLLRKYKKQLKKRLPYICGSKPIRVKAALEDGKGKPRRSEKNKKFMVNERVDTKTEREHSNEGVEAKQPENSDKKMQEEETRPKKEKDVIVSSNEENGSDLTSIKVKGADFKRETKNKKKSPSRINSHSTSMSTESSDVHVIVYKKGVSSKKWDKVVRLLYGRDNSPKESRIRRVVLNGGEYSKLFGSKQQVQRDA